MKAEYTATIKKIGNSHWVIIPAMQLGIMRAQEGDVVSVKMEKLKKIE